MADSPSADSLEARLRAMEARKIGSYDPRTEHLDSHGNTLFINRLILEDSPYLLQHAHNPVNWYAWGEEAFAAAAAEAKPVFLSIGYSTCHWCHVMEVESFDNVEVGKLLNRDFISIKLDREQYPDIDEFYMTGVQLMSGHGGWPMSNFMLADGKPFFSATYFPAPSFIDLLQKIASAWQHKRQELESSAIGIERAIDRILGESKDSVSLDEKILEQSVQALLQREDKVDGGLSGQPKFPQEPLLLLLLDHAGRTRDLEAAGFLDRALHAMAQGGIYDQFGGGFHRYSVDAQWLVPHFEKMLYNQSQLGLVFLQAYQLTGKAMFARICQQILDYVLRDMQYPEGGFYSATDADSEGSEAVFFLWTIQQLEEVLVGSEVDFIVSLYDISEAGNFEGSNIPNLSRPLSESAGEYESGDFYSELDRILHKLYLAREQRIHPLRDDKLIVAWTGAMINTLAKAAYVFGNDEWLRAAERAAALVWAQNVDEHHCLRRIYLDGEVSISAQLEDYANLAAALITLFDVTAQSDYLHRAAQLIEIMQQDFWDEEKGTFYLTPKGQPGPQLSRSRNASDGAILSPVATALSCLRLLQQRSDLIPESKLNSDLHYREKIKACIASLSADINDSPLGHPSMLRVIQTTHCGDLDLIQYAGNGKAKLSIKGSVSEAETKKEIEIHVTLQAGWHITAPQQESSNLAPIELRVDEQEQHWQILACDYPKSSGRIQDGDGGEIPVLEKEFTIHAVLQRSELTDDLLSSSAGLELKLQLCDDSSCLLPETLNFRMVAALGC